MRQDRSIFVLLAVVLVGVLLVEIANHLWLGLVLAIVAGFIGRRAVRRDA